MTICVELGSFATLCISSKRYLVAGSSSRRTRQAWVVNENTENWLTAETPGDMDVLSNEIY